MINLQLGVCYIAGEAQCHDDYTYIDDLMRLESCQDGKQLKLPPGALRVLTPLDLKAWSTLLNQHPDRRFVEYILNGIARGFRIGFNHTPEYDLYSTKRNMQSANDHSQVIDEYLQDECDKQRIAGPYHITQVLTSVDLL